MGRIRQSGLTLEEFEGPRYQRIGHIQMLIGEGVLADDLRRRRQPARQSAHLLEAMPAKQ